MKRKNNRGLPMGESAQFWQKVWRDILREDVETPHVRRALEMVNATLPDGGIPPEDGSEVMMRFFNMKYLEYGVVDVWRHLRLMIIGFVSPTQALDDAMLYARQKMENASPLELRCWLVDQALMHEAAAKKAGMVLKPFPPRSTVIPLHGGNVGIQIATTILEYPSGKFGVIGLVSGQIASDTGPAFDTRADAVAAADKIMAASRASARSKGLKMHETMRN